MTTKTAATLRDVGPALFGQAWQSALAAELGVSDRTMRRWAAGDVEIPAGVWGDLARLCRKRGATLEKWAARLDS